MDVPNKVKICAIYGRVSVEDAANVEHGSLEQQEHMGKEMACQLAESTGVPHIVKYTLIEQKGVSGGHTNRPQYQKLLELISTRKIDVLISKEISRLSRSVRDFCDLMELCRDNEVTVHIKGLDVNPNTPMGAAMFKVLAVIAEFEREINRERTRSSIQSAMINNAKIPGGVMVLGFDREKDKKGRWSPNREELKQVVHLMQIFLDTLSYKEVLRDAKRNGIKNKNGRDFTQNSLKRLLTNPKYMGEMRVGVGEKQSVQSRNKKETGGTLQVSLAWFLT